MISHTAGFCAEFLGRATDADWGGRVPGLDMSVAGVVAHMAEACLWYAIDLSAGGVDLTPVEHRVNPDGPNTALIATLLAYAHVLESVVEVSPDSARGFHPMGTADPSGFAAMACDEMLIHTDDAARGLGIRFHPPDELTRPVLRRLFPWVSPVDDVWEQLRWVNGRTSLGDLTQLSDWAWHCAPLDQWDGTVATKPPQTSTG